MDSNVPGFNYKEAFRGFFDADGSISIRLINRKTIKLKKNKDIQHNIPVGFELAFAFSQSQSKQDVFYFFEKELNLSFSLKEKKRERKGVKYREVTSHIHISSLQGQKIFKILEEKPLLNPHRQNDFLIATTLNTLIKKKVNSSKKGLASLIYLAYQTQNQRELNSQVIKKRDINKFYNALELSQNELQIGIAEGKNLYKSIWLQVQDLERKLPQMILPVDYMVGVHWGDGGLTCFMSWTDSNFVLKPVWTITDSSKIYLSAFQNTHKKGALKKQKGAAWQYVLSSIKSAREIIIPMFSNKPMPLYKKEQYRRFYLAVEILTRKEHFTFEGGKRLLDLIYDMSKNSRRPYSKEEYLNKLEQILTKKVKTKKIKS